MNPCADTLTCSGTFQTAFTGKIIALYGPNSGFLKYPYFYFTLVEFSQVKNKLFFIVLLKD